jgi:hypothetical protein
MSDNSDTFDRIFEERKDWFWNIVKKAKQNESKLTKILNKLSRQEIIDFATCFEVAACELRCSPYTDFQDECSEDEITDISHWVVGRGQKFYEDVIKNPKKIPKDEDEIEDSTFVEVYISVFAEKFDEDICDHIPL